MQSGNGTEVHEGNDPYGKTADGQRVRNQRMGKTETDHAKLDDQTGNETEGKSVNKEELELLLMDMFDNIVKVAKSHYPGINHVTMFSIDGSCNLTAYANDGSELNAHKTKDGFVGLEESLYKDGVKI